MNKTTCIYTDASTTDTGPAGVAMVVITANSLTEYTEIVGGFNNDAAETWAVIWAIEHAVRYQLDAAIYTDCIQVPVLWQRYRHAQLLTPLADPYRRLAALAYSHPHLEIHHVKRGTSIFNRRADHLAGMVLRQSKRLDLGHFLSMHEIHAACSVAQAKWAAR